MPPAAVRVHVASQPAAEVLHQEVERRRRADDETGEAKAEEEPAARGLRPHEA